MSSVASSYKKQNGTLSISKDNREVSWIQTGAAAPTIRLLVADISNLQQTPEKSPKVSIKIFTQTAGANKPEDFTFSLTSATTARADQAAITKILRQEIENIRARKQQPVASATVPDDPGAPPAAFAIAQALAVSTGSNDSAFTDAKLLANSELQRSLLQSNVDLKQRFMQALTDKPDNISTHQFASQFWVTRVHLLREHAVSRGQTQGSYNVLSEVKPKNVDGTNRLNLSKEQIQLIFKQHPLVKKVYNESVPAMNEMEFWSRFFVSRLIKKLKGEKITENDPTDPKLDRYLSLGDGADVPVQLDGAHIPRFIDLEGNEQNHSQKRGNAPDMTMQPNNHEKVPILRVLNSMSEKMMADTATAKGEVHGPVGLDEETFNEIRLRDLQKDSLDNRIMLNIKDQKRFHTTEGGDHRSKEAIIYARQNPQNVLATISNESRSLTRFNSLHSGLDLEEALGINDDSSSEDEQHHQKRTLHIGSKSGRAAATKQIVGAIRQKRAQTDDYSAPPGSFAPVPFENTDLTIEIRDSLALTHSTTIEFLHYFWSVFHSGDPERAGEAQNMIGALDKSLDRIKANAKQAEAGRRAYIDRLNAQLEEHFRRSGKRKKLDLRQAPGGAEAVNAMMAPTVRAIKEASDRFREEYELQISQSKAVS
ncbi:RNA polymerase II transcription factor-like protein [Pseudovirgaria hyperparasitica]|uniref:RNA polymerase II transcription factor-like protein n=1 Tax=Pseudovirgaria hyperparasitica TaxID=470096 RepID=A0A6A6VY35_9PEZI|nr:RNA polymerase II transcription factor-like protein [Pseudovirgaria hyperparasitica]KAF2754749.1 RNA polymerase II transcription factor-like protein [Pseudovirgaria hyperparasitica]